MPPTTLARVVAAVVGLMCIACTGESPARPSPSADATGAVGTLAAQGVPGVYDLSFNVLSGETLQQVSSLSVGQEMILMAHVTDGSGAAAQRGAVTFEYCSYNKLPPNDITRADEAPKEACEQEGTASWARFRSITLDATCPGLGTGYVCSNFGAVAIPRTVGFRFRFSGQGSSIASGKSASLNFTWT